MGAKDTIWAILTVLASGYAVLMVASTVFFAIWIAKELLWPSPEYPEKIARMVEKEVEETSLASWQEKQDQS